MAAEHEFVAPVRQIKHQADFSRWLDSEGYQDFCGWLQFLCDCVKGKKLTDKLPDSPAVDRVLNLLSKLSDWVDETPPLQQPNQRFGNKAFTTWWLRLRDNCQDLIREVLPDELKKAAVELEPYLREGFGNATRIDYGTGHELKFMAFVCCLMKINVIPKEDGAAVVLRIGSSYMQLVRKLQQEYRMEPAGSHGVWGLDDFQFIPFIWGAAQLIGQDEITPKQFVEKEVAEKLADQYMFMSCIKYINEVKTGPFYEHSNTLWGISGVPDWTKVTSGLIKMYKAEVLGKFPVIQHFPFGTILCLDPSK